MKHLQNKETTFTDEVFLGQIEIDNNPRAYQRLCTIDRGMRYDMNMYGLWIKKNSTAHNLAILLGFQLRDPQGAEQQRHSNQYKWNLNQLKNT
jgi:hypothetical protein